jgi:hypothetical protein
MARRSRYTDSGLGAALTIYLGVCVGLTTCFGAGLYWLMEPSVFPNPGLAAYKPPANFVVTFCQSIDAAGAAAGAASNCFVAQTSC